MTNAIESGVKILTDKGWKEVDQLLDGKVLTSLPNGVIVTSEITSVSKGINPLI